MRSDVMTEEVLGGDKEGVTKQWRACSRAANRLADLVCLMYHPKDAKARQTWPTATWTEIIASELGVSTPEEVLESREALRKTSEHYDAWLKERGL